MLLKYGRKDNGSGTGNGGFERWAWRIALLLVFAAALAWRWHFASKSHIYTYDSYYYLVLARNLRHGLHYAVAGHPHFKFLPLYPVSIAFLNLFVPNLETAGKLSNVLFSAACVFPVYSIGRLIFGRRAGIAAAALFAFEPISVAWSSVPMSEGLFTLLTCLSALFFLRWMKGCRRRDLYLAAAAAGLTAITRWEGMFLIAFMGMFLLYYWYRGRARLEHVLIAGAIALAPAAVFALRNLIAFGTPFKSAYADEMNNYLPQWEMFSKGERLRRYLIFSDLNPADISRRSYHWGYLLFGYGGLACSLLVRRFRRYGIFLWAWLIFMGPMHFIWYFASVRFLIPAVPPLCLGAGALLGVPVEKLECRRLAVSTAAVLLALALCVAAVLAVTSRPAANDFYKRNITALEDDVGGFAAKDALLWIKDNGGEGEVVTNLGAEASFYLGRDALFLGDWQQFEPADVEPHLFLEEARERGVRYLVIHSTRRDIEDAMKIAGIDYGVLDQLVLVKEFHAPPPNPDADETYAFVFELPPEGE
jgi:asparagine N-glycosylation enzyme membrane subunit Stt3